MFTLLFSFSSFLKIFMPLIALMFLLLWLVCFYFIISCSLYLPCCFWFSLQTFPLVTDICPQATPFMFCLCFFLRIVLTLDIMQRDIYMPSRKCDHLGRNRLTCSKRPAFYLPYLAFSGKTPFWRFLKAFPDHAIIFKCILIETNQKQVAG